MNRAACEAGMQRHGGPFTGHGPDVDVMDADQAWNMATQLCLDVGNVEPGRNPFEQHIGRLPGDGPGKAQDQSRYEQ